MTGPLPLRWSRVTHHASRILAAVLCLALCVEAAFAVDKPFELWTGPPIPGVQDIPWLDAVTHVRVHRATKGVDQFLHGASIVEHAGTLFACWANSPVDENSALESVRGRRSTDGGLTWSEVEVIAPGFQETAERHSHAPFLSHKGQLWAFAARWGVGPGKPFAGLRAEAFMLNEQTGKWESRGIVGHDCWPCTEPLRMADGNWITAGPSRDAVLPRVMISHGDDLLKWDTVSIPMPKGISTSFAETTVIPDGRDVLAIVRPRSPKLALVAESDDFGRTWSPCRVSNYPMSDAKPYAGVLSTGQRYLVSNFPAKGMPQRDTLVIAVGRPGGEAFSRVWKVRFGPSKAPLGGRAKARQWSYPYAHEHDGKLYVVYSISKEDCGLSIIPLRALRWEPLPEPPPGKLVGHWPCDGAEDGRLEDASGEGNHGTLLGGARFAPGVKGKALGLDGVDDIVEVPDAKSLDFSHGAFTVTAWIKVDALGRGQQMIVGKNVYARNQREWGLMIDKDDLPTLYVRAGDWRTVKATTRPTPGAWCHIAAVVERGRGRIYVNGKQEGEAALGTRLPNTAAPLSIGGQRNAGKPMQFLKGAVDDVRLWSKALTKHQIREEGGGNTRRARWIDMGDTSDMVLAETVGVQGMDVALGSPPKGFSVLDDVGILAHEAVRGQVVHRTAGPKIGIYETKATLTPDGDDLHIFMPHRWRQAVHLTVKASDLARLPTRAELAAAIEARP